MLELFTEHPRANRMTYAQHVLVSGTYAVEFFVLSLKAAVHAVFPFWFSTSSTDYILTQARVVQSVRENQEEDKKKEGCST